MSRFHDTRLAAWSRWLRSPQIRDLLHEWRRRLGGEPVLPAGPVGYVLVVCHGNVARSPVGAALLARRRPQLTVRSAGLEAAEGNPSDDRTIEAARAFGVALQNHRTHRLTGEDVDWSHLILVMEGRQVHALRRRWPRAAAKTRLLGDYLERPPHGIPDPWGGDDERYQMIFRRVEAAVAALAERLEQRDRLLARGSDRA